MMHQRTTIVFKSGRTPIELDFLYMPAYTPENKSISVGGQIVFIEDIHDIVFTEVIERTIFVND